MAGALDPSRVIHGTKGQIYIDGVWQTNLNHIEATVERNKEELNLCGTDWVSHKYGALKGTGTISGFKITSDMIVRGFSTFSIISKLDDPESYGYERIRLDNVKADRIGLLNWTAGETVKEEHPFTFEGYELLDPITAS